MAVAGRLVGPAGDGLGVQEHSKNKAVITSIVKSLSSFKI
jgi:hypothetical protein